MANSHAVVGDWVAGRCVKPYKIDKVFTPYQPPAESLGRLARSLRPGNARIQGWNCLSIDGQVPDRRAQIEAL